MTVLSRKVTDNYLTREIKEAGDTVTFLINFNWVDDASDPIVDDVADNLVFSCSTDYNPIFVSRKLMPRNLVREIRE